MEESIIRTLEGHAEDAEEYPETKNLIQSHIEQTRSQADRVRDEIERLGGNVSPTKSGLAKAFGFMQGIATDMAADKVIKNAITEHATEHFEHASYLALAEAADFYGEPETARVCRDIIEEEMEMGRKVEEAIPTLTRQFLERQDED